MIAASLAALFLAASPAPAGTAQEPLSGHHHEARSVAIADVRTVDREARTALLRHEALDALAMPAMVMEFHIGEGVDMALLEPGAALRITVIDDKARGLTIIAAEPEHAPED